LTEAQRVYVARYCERLREALNEEDDGKHIIDMDAVADAVGKDKIEKPPFYYVEQRQQNRYSCNECGEFNDIIGRFGYCSGCGTRNDLHELKEKILPEIRARINDDGPLPTCLKDIASAFDSFVAQYTRQLIQNIPLKPSRRNRIDKMRFHNLEPVEKELREAFDICIFDGIKDSDQKFATKMFCRRHVHEHNGGEVDEKYLAETGDTSVRIKQSLREDKGDVHRFADLVGKMANNLHEGFHEIFPPENGSIKRHAEYKKRMAAAR
jgi:hypothetical protein